MGFLKRVFRPVRKIAKKIIPKEIRPALPFLAATYLGPAGAGTFSSGIKAALQRGLIGAGVSAATDEEGDPLRAGILAATPGLLAETAQLGAVNAELAGMGRTAGALERTADFVRANEGLKTIAAQTGIDQAAKLAEIQQDEIDKYNEELRKQGVLDKTKRRTSILNIYLNAGYEPDYVNSMLDRYGYDKGGLAMFKNMTPRMQGFKAPTSARSLFRKKPDDIEYTALLEGIQIDDDDDDDDKDKKKRGKGEKREPVPVTTEGDLAAGLQAAADGVQKAFGRSFGEMEPVPMLRFARGGEVEIEEETDDLGIMDLMRDQGVEYGEQVSNTQNDKILEMLFEKYLEMGLSPKDAAEAAQNEFDRMSQKPDEGIMQMASAYKTDIEEMYEQYVFEMEEMGLQPMSFREFVDQARSGMADGGDVPEYDIEGETMEGRMMEDFMREGMNKGKQENRKRLFDDYERYKRRRKTKEKGIEVANGGIISMADGGIMEKDMRGGGFIPEGTKERADDVPARLSKNEFVMTADAVRAAGGGSVNKGAKRMYDMMYSLEGKV